MQGGALFVCYTCCHTLLLFRIVKATLLLVKIVKLLVVLFCYEINYNCIWYLIRCFYVIFSFFNVVMYLFFYNQNR